MLRNRHSSGLSLGTVLVVTALVAVLAFGLAGVSVGHLNLMTHHGNAQQASHLADSVVALGVEKMLASEDNGYGEEGQEPAPLEISLEGTAPDGLGRLTFDPDEARRLGIPFSTNNINGAGSTDGWGGTVVPPKSVHLIGVGESGGVTRRVEAFLHIPPFPYALASTGRVDCRGGVVVAGIDSQIVVDGNALAVDPEDLKPADLASNARVDDSVVLGPDSMVAGNVRSAGGLSGIDPGAYVGGERLAGASPVRMPEVDLSTYDPGAEGEQIDPPEPGTPYSSAGETFEGMVRVNGDLTIEPGGSGIEMKGAVLFVDGDLNVLSGGLRGRGIVVVTGNVDIQGGVELQAGSQVALLSAGDVSLHGSGPEGSFFQGLVYTQGRLEADQISVIGTMIAGNEEADSVTLTDARLLSPPDSRRVEVPVAVGGGSDTDTDTTPSGVGDDGGFRNLNSGGLTGRLECVSRDDRSLGDAPFTQEVTPLPGGRWQIEFFRRDSGSLVPIARGILDNPSADPRSDPDVRQAILILGRQLEAAGLRQENETQLSARIAGFVGGAIRFERDNPETPDPEEDPGPDPEIRIITFDPSEFLKTEDSIRLLFWRQF